MSRAEARAQVIRALAEKKRRSPADLETELRAAGEECPYDSIWLVKAGVRAAKNMGVKFTPRASDACAFKSVEALTTYLCERASQEDAA